VAGPLDTGLNRSAAGSALADDSAPEPVADAEPVEHARAAAVHEEKAWRRHIRTTREGKAFIFVTIGVGITAFNTGNNLLFLVLGFMLSLIVLSGVMSETAIRAVSITRRLPSRAFAGQLCLIELVLRNDKLRAPSYSLEIEDLVAGESRSERRCYFLKVGPGAEQAAVYRRTPSLRGALFFEKFHVITRYPFGIFEKWRVLSQPAELLVYPALLPPSQLPRAFPQHGLDAPTTKLGSGTEIAGLRGYEVGDDARSIHWQRTAALGRVMVTERHSDATAQLTVLLDNVHPDAARFERMVSLAATAVVAALARGQSAEVIARGSRSPLVPGHAAPDPILRYLAKVALVDNVDDAPGFARVAPHARVLDLGKDAADPELVQAQAPASPTPEVV